VVEQLCGGLLATARDGDWEFYEPELSTICAISTYSIFGATP
jgi:hypothetical protein